MFSKGVCHTVALPLFTLKHILRQKKNYGNSNISPSCKNRPNLQNPKTLAKIKQQVHNRHP
jgi:hypothetical protein